VQSYSFEVPANPVLATSVDTTPECSTETIGMAINGVPIYSGAVSANCDILDVDDAAGEWTSFDFCGGHGRCLAMDCTGAPRNSLRNSPRNSSRNSPRNSPRTPL
jgi:hypothetical protein